MHSADSAHGPFTSAQILHTDRNEIFLVPTVVSILHDSRDHFSIISAPTGRAQTDDASQFLWSSVLLLVVYINATFDVTFLTDGNELLVGNGGETTAYAILQFTVDDSLITPSVDGAVSFCTLRLTHSYSGVGRHSLGFCHNFYNSWSRATGFLELWWRPCWIRYHYRHCGSYSWND